MVFEMNNNFSARRKIFPKTEDEISSVENHQNKIEIGPSALALAEWDEAGLNLPNLSNMRKYRLNRIVKELKNADRDAILLFDT